MTFPNVPEGPLVIETTATFSCPFCGHQKDVTIGYIRVDPDAEREAGLPVGLHQEPRCRQFEVMDLTEFLRAARLMVS